MKRIVFIFLLMFSSIACPPSKQSLVTREKGSVDSGIIAVNLIFPPEIDTIQNRRVIVKVSDGSSILQTQSLSIADTYNQDFSLYNIRAGENRLIEVFIFDEETKFQLFNGFAFAKVSSGELTEIDLELKKISVNNYCNGIVAKNLVFSKNAAEIEPRDTVNLILEFDNPLNVSVTVLWIAKTEWLSQDAGVFSSYLDAQTQWTAPSTLVSEEVEFNFEAYILEKDTLTICDIYKQSIVLIEKEGSPLEEEEGDICAGIDLTDGAIVIEDDDIRSGELISLGVDATKISNPNSIDLYFRFAANGGSFGDTKDVWQAPSVNNDTEFSIRLAIGPVNNESIVCDQQEKRVIVKP